MTKILDIVHRLTKARNRLGASALTPIFFFQKFYFFIIMLKPFKLHKKCPYAEFFWSVFSCIRTENGETRRISSDVGRMRTRKTPNMDTFYAVSLTSTNVDFDIFSLILVTILSWSNNLQQNRK